MDNGAPQQSIELAAKITDPEILLSFSRQRGANNSLFTESLIVTLNYHSYTHI